MVPFTRMMIGVLTLARAHSAALICAPVLAVTTAPPWPPVTVRPKPTGVPVAPPELELDELDELELEELELELELELDELPPELELEELDPAAP